MVFHHNFIVNVKFNGQIMREMNENGAQFVYIPFGSEYSVFVKNLDSRRAAVTISIDGVDVLGGSTLVINGNSQGELMGFLRGNVAEKRFRFIQKTQQIAEYRGDKADDGVIRVEYRFEKPQTVQYLAYDGKPMSRGNEQWYPKPSGSGDGCRGICSSPSGANKSRSFAAKLSAQCDSQTMGWMGNDVPQRDEGITVKGSDCRQRFDTSTMGELESTSQVVTLILRGATQNATVWAPVWQPITVNTKITCPTCGQRSKSHHKFCSNCSTSLR